jgi:predicted ATPase
MGIKVDYPYLMKDLNFKLFIKNASDGIDIKDTMISLMKGEFKKDAMGRFFFDKQGQKIKLLNTATGIKYFGLFQVLSQNNYLTENTILILDEPENHLHPKWQLKMAEVIVELVKNGVKVLVNSHSPYMVEALKRYSEVEKIEEKTNFYLAEEGYIKKINDSNSETLVAIYEKLSEPYDVFEQMESDRFTNG